MLEERLIVGCYTKGNYEREANERLIKSVKKLNLPYIIGEIPCRGSWVLNNAMCQLYLQEMDKRYPNADFIYCDVDGYFHSDPWPDLINISCDIACYYINSKQLNNILNNPKKLFRDSELCSGTLYLPSNGRRTELLNKWVDLNIKNPKIWDQRNLQILLEKEDFKVHILGPEYCCIFDLQRKLTPDIIPICEHFQASRRYKI